MKPATVLIVSDAWEPQVNGVVRTLRATKQELERRGHRIVMVTPDQFRSIPCPTYPEIRLALAMPHQVERLLQAAAADCVHIATEGPLGLITRRWCVRQGLPFTTSYHTQFPDYVAARTPLTPSMVWRYVRWFHRPAAQILTATESLRAQLAANGLVKLAHWTRGVDQRQFHPAARPLPSLADLPRPIHLYVGRLAVEKSVEAFLELDLPGSTVIVGDGPQRALLESRYPHAKFLGALHGDRLASAYASADVFVFPSKTDTFGLVLIEAMACGTPVAAFPVMGPVDIVTTDNGALRGDLREAIVAALTKDRDAVARSAACYNWSNATDQFVAALVPKTIAEFKQA